MKKHRLHPMIFLTVLFLVFLLGLFIGRNLNHADIQVSTFISAQAQYVANEAPSPTSPAETKAPVQPININTADATLLQTLPGIGDTTAMAIIAYREAHGPFRHPADLLHVEGIGEKKLAQIIDYITVQEDLS